jgi:hypothetical protein
MRALVVSEIQMSPGAESAVTRNRSLRFARSATSVFALRTNETFWFESSEITML